MKTVMRPFIVLILSLLCAVSLAQDHSEIAGFKTGELSQEKASIPGLWQVNQVTVGDEFLTPTAKWFLFEANGQQSGGNGWIQNSKGTWTYNTSTYEFLTSDSEGRTDEYGAFNLSFEDAKMIWQRQEDGLDVKVILSPIEEKPLAPWDKITGSWKILKYEMLNSVTNIGEITDVEPYSYYFGWDRRYRQFDASGKLIATGIWQIEAHSPWLWMISDKSSEKTGQSIRFENGLLVLEEKKGPVTETSYFEKN